MVHRQWSLVDVGRIRLSVWTIRYLYFTYEILEEGEGDTHVYAQGGQRWQDTSHWTYNYFIICQVAVLIVSYHCVKKSNVCTVPMNIYILKVLWTGFHNLHWTRRVMGYKYLLLAAHTSTDLIV